MLDQLALIALGRAAGFSLDEIAVMTTSGELTNINRRMLADKADEIDRTVARLRAMSKGLKHAARCPAPSHMECPTFRRLMKAAFSGALENPVKTSRQKRKAG